MEPDRSQGSRERTMALPALDYSLLGEHVAPISGAGGEVLCALTGPSWCGYCGYTGRVLGPRQAACPERHGWHAWLAENANHETWELADA